MKIVDAAAELRLCRARLKSGLVAQQRVVEQSALIAHLSRELQHVRDDLEAAHTRYYRGAMEIRRVAVIYRIPSAVVRAKFQEWLATQDFAALKADHKALREAAKT